MKRAARGHDGGPPTDEGDSPLPLTRVDPARPPLRWLMRLPLWLYRARLGWLLGERFARLTTRGRRTGLPREVVLEVLGQEPATGALLIASAWGSRAAWLRNLEAWPRTQVQVGRRRFTAEVERLPEEAGADALRTYAGRYPLAYRFFIGPLLLGRRPDGRAEEFAELARRTPVLCLRPLEES
jgi:deazaflavin-dependent oxidoreductase (nitroreductase family)